jgi:hypothetical protein
MGATGEVMAAAAPAAVPARQPGVGVAGLVIVGAVFALLGTVWEPEFSLLVIGPISVFWLPVLVVSAIWWGGWPARGLARPAAGLLNTAIFVVAAVVLTWLGQLVVGRADIGASFSRFAGPASIEAGELTAFPWTIPLSAAVFVTMLQLTFVCGRWPLQKAPPVAGGFAALVLSWAIGTLAYYLFTTWDPVLPPEAQAAIGLRSGGVLAEMNALEFVALLVSIAVWQVVFFIGLRGWPVTEIARPGARLLAGNVLALGGGWLSYLVLRQGFGWSVEAVSGAGGCAVGATLVAAMLFEAWPFHGESAQGTRVGLAVVGTALAFVLYYGLRALGATTGTWDVAPLQLWVAVSGLNYVAAVVILHYAVWGRWPLPPPSAPGS